MNANGTSDEHELISLLAAARRKREPAEMPQWLGEGVPQARAYELQRRHTDAVLSQVGGGVIGWKIGGGDMATMAANGFTGPGRGPIFSALAFDSPARLRRDDFIACIVEAEIAVVLAEDIREARDRDGVIRAVASITPSIEIADSRFADFLKRPIPAVIADLGYAGAWVRGKPATDFARIDLSALHVRLFANGVEVRQGTGGLFMSDPFEPLRLLADDLVRGGQPLRAGQVISTGTYVMPYFAKAGETIVADFGELGQVEAAFS